MVTENNAAVVEEPVVGEVVVEAPAVDEPAETAPETVVTEPTTTEEPETAPVAEFVEDNKDEEEVCPECGKPVDECECEDDKKQEYVLEEIAEYVALQTEYAALETRFNELSTAHEALKAENETLIAFKANVDKKEKEALIKSFYMLSDDLKKDVIDNIDTYSLDDIEAKLSILCVRNKVSFSLENDTEEEPISYNLSDAGASNDNVPEWVKAIQSHVAENL